MGKFQHENIIGLIDVFATDNYAKINEILIVIEIMDLDLRQIIYSQNRLTDEHRRFFSYQILKALKYIHSHITLINGNCDLKIWDFMLTCIQGNKEFEIFRNFWSFNLKKRTPFSDIVSRLQINEDKLL